MMRTGNNYSGARRAHSQRPAQPALPPVRKRYGQTMLGGPGGRVRRECWSAETTDGVWGFERLETPGTPWQITHLLTQTIVGWGYGSLRSARQQAAGMTTADVIDIRLRRVEERAARLSGGNK